MESDWLPSRTRSHASSNETPETTSSNMSRADESVAEALRRPVRVQQKEEYFEVSATAWLESLFTVMGPGRSSSRTESYVSSDQVPQTVLSSMSHPYESGSVEALWTPEKVQQIDEYTEGGATAWLAVAGATACLVVSFGWVNVIGIFQEHYQSNQFRDYTLSDIAWIPSLQSRYDPDSKSNFVHSNDLQFSSCMLGYCRRKGLGRLWSPLFARYRHVSACVWLDDDQYLQDVLSDHSKSSSLLRHWSFASLQSCFLKCMCRLVAWLQCGSTDLR
jgi:hypothetical protein